MMQPKRILPMFRIEISDRVGGGLGHDPMLPDGVLMIHHRRDLSNTSGIIETGMLSTQVTKIVPVHDIADQGGTKLECPNCAVSDHDFQWTKPFDRKGPEPINHCGYCDYKWRWKELL